MLIFLIKQIFKNKSLARSLMNWQLKSYTLKGKILDIGGGKNTSYYKFLNKDKDSEIISLDMIHESVNSNDKKIINFEKDQLPFKNDSVDQVILFNILEHIYNHNFLVKEVQRVLVVGGNILGFVPFLVNYHPDPNDYFRYTNEALEKIFLCCGFKNIQVMSVSIGPWSAGYNLISHTIPKYLRFIVFLIFYFIDYIILKIKPSFKDRYPMGYLFIAKK